MIHILHCEFYVRLSFQEVDCSIGPDECGNISMLPSSGSGCGKGNVLFKCKSCENSSHTLFFRAQLLLFFPPKVTGKKMYAAGQWSSAVVSSLFIPKPQECDTKDTACSQPQVHIYYTINKTGLL